MEHRKNYALLILLFFSLIWQLKGQDFQHLTTTNRCFVEDIKTVELYLDNYPYSQPIIKLNSDENLLLSFDDLSNESRYLKYTFIHCSYDWKIDGLSQMEYIDGFLEDEISDYSYSFNTITPYTHYELSIPSELMRLTKSGNYLLFVYDTSMDNPILVRRFMVIENKPIIISGKVNRSSDVNTMHSMQEVDFTALTGSYDVKNPSRYLHANIVQNGRWDNAIIGLTYRSGKPGEYTFDYDNNANAFNGGNDFRFFDIKSLRYNGNRIVSISYREDENVAFVLEDIAKPYTPYSNNPTLNGFYYIKNEDFNGKNSEDYVNTYFTLRADFELKEGDIYVFGALTDWKILDEAKMKRNPKTNYWETSLFLKQGFYNYQYVLVKRKNQMIDETFIEGSHWETQNKYTIFLYLQDEGTVYDKLIGSLELFFK